MSPGPARETRRFAFLDRDGTLVPDTGYPHRPEECVLLPGVVGGLRALARAGFRLAVVTNQSGIGRGYFSAADYAAFEGRLEALLARERVPVERSYHCPHLPDAGCACRKPAPGLLLRARDELGAALAQSWVIGDSACDAALAGRAGCRGAVLVGPRGRAEAKGGVAWAPDLPAAAAHILAAERAPASAESL